MSAATAVYVPAHSHDAAFGAKTSRGVVAAEYLVEIVRYKQATYNAVFPDVPGCVATSTDLNEVRSLIKDGLRFHLELLVKEGKELPEVRTTSSTGGELDAEEEFIEAAYVQFTLQVVPQ